MSMNKIRPQVYAIILVIAAVFSAVAFLVPIEREEVFWIGYVSGIIAILLQIPVFGFAYPSQTQLKSKVLGYPVFRIGIIYLAVQMILSFVLLQPAITATSPYGWPSCSALSCWQAP